MDLTFDSDRVYGLTDVVGTPRTQYLDAASVAIDLDFDGMGTEHVDAKVVEYETVKQGALGIDLLAVEHQRMPTHNWAADAKMSSHRDLAK